MQPMDEGALQNVFASPLGFSLSIEVQALMAQLKGGGLYTRTALLLLPPFWLGREGAIAVRLGTSHVDYQQWKVAQLALGQNFLMYSAERLINELDILCREEQDYATLLVSLFDLPLSALSSAERRKFWNFFFEAFMKRPRAVLLGLPENMTELLPDDLERRWRSSGRLAYWPQQA
jgi:hypothetical protein